MKAIKRVGNKISHPKSHNKPVEKESKEPVVEGSSNIGKSNVVNQPSLAPSSTSTSENIPYIVIETITTEQSLPRTSSSTSDTNLPSTLLPSTLLPVTNISSSTSENMATTTERIEKAPIVLETIKHEQIEEIQPIITRDVHRTNVSKITQPLYDKEIRAPVYSDSSLPINETIKGELLTQYKDLISNVKEGKETQTIRVEKEPIIIETHKRVIIEEFHPVIYREIVHPEYVRTIVPMSERRFFNEFRGFFEQGSVRGSEQYFQSQRRLQEVWMQGQQQQQYGFNNQMIQSQRQFVHPAQYQQYQLQRSNLNNNYNREYNNRSQQFNRKSQSDADLYWDQQQHWSDQSYWNNNSNNNSISREQRRSLPSSQQLQYEQQQQQHREMSRPHYPTFNQRQMNERKKVFWNERSMENQIHPDSRFNQYQTKRSLGL